MSDKTERKRLEILRVLQEVGKPVGSSKITERLFAAGHDISERTVRFYLGDMDAEGLTENLGRRGRLITHLGLQELGSARVVEKVGYLAAKIDQMTYRMSFELSRRTGTVVVNVSIVKKGDLQKYISSVQDTFKAGFGMGRLATLFAPGSMIDGEAIPEGFVGLGTVCSITLNGVLLLNGIPTCSKFGGLLEVHRNKPVRFVEIIHYEGTTLDPLEIFIRGHMTDCFGAAKAGDGRIGASFRELPAESRDRVIELAGELDRAGLGGLLVIGWPGQPVLEIPVNHGRVGAIVIGGLNPAAVLEEKGVTTRSRALATLAEYESFFHYEELGDRLREIG